MGLDRDHLGPLEPEVTFDQAAADCVLPSVEESLETGGVVVHDHPDLLGPEATQHRVGDHREGVPAPARRDRGPHGGVGVDREPDQAGIDDERLGTGDGAQRLGLELVAQGVDRGAYLGLLLGGNMRAVDPNVRKDRTGIPRVLGE